MSDPTATVAAYTRSVPTAGEVVGLMARFTAWCIVAGAIVEELRDAWR